MIGFTALITLIFANMGTWFDEGDNFKDTYDSRHHDYPYVTPHSALIIA